ncbi:N5-glutamine methyltransferase family protein [Egicoccus halophilus]|uniref:peptide chain release factor N(5)-glutamine methyltransferase n=1 Tax=Egicoccus halophilus TaxID=1670830 RepID=A0A8J3EWM5_9ACTN|nr:HemK/PrmC family methyltransferase [Egicoccus halophilus]GGI04011.1 release factor glutamine methyltransferase [Egicoccus halophilus]
MTPVDRATVEAVAARLTAAGVPTPAVDARWLVEHVVEVAGSCTGCGAALLDGLVARRAAREPLQLVLGRSWFRELELLVAPGVFVPRPETEIVAGVAIDEARGLDAPIVAEPCTGTGAIALSVAVEVPGARVVATDLDAAAVDLARDNLGRVLAGDAGPPLVADQVEVLPGDLLEPLAPKLRGRLDVLVSNPPYLPAADRGSWEPEVGDHDPDRALVGGVDGHEVVDRLLALAVDWLRPGGLVVLEIDDRRGADARTAASAVGLTDVALVHDLTGAERAVVARRRQERPPTSGHPTRG